MRNSKRLLSILLAVLICLTCVAVTTTADIEPLTAYRFETENYDASKASNDPTSVKASNDGSVRIKSDHIQQQYQMAFKVSDQQAMKEAIEETCEYYDGFLSVNIAMNSALTAYGSACRPTVSVSLTGKNLHVASDRIATTGDNSLYSEQTGQFILDVSKFMEEEYTDQIQYVFIQVQCYNWGCGGGLGTKPDVTVYPIKVFNSDFSNDDLPTIATQKPDPNQKTFFKFSPKAKNDDNNDPELLYYSSDGVKWRMGVLAKEENYGYARLTNSKKNFREQVQTSFRVDQMGDAAANALNLAKQGSGYLKLSVTLEDCVNMQGEPTIAEVGVAINTQAGIKAEAPPQVEITAWQYPGTTRDYYLDVSQIEHISQITNLVFRVQNYWWYRAGTNEMFDWNVESKYAGKDTGEALGHTKCEILPSLVISPISVYNGNREDIKNTDYDLVLNDFNKNGGVVPETITVDDPNVRVDGDGSDEQKNSTASGATTVNIPNGEQISSTVQTNMTIPAVVCNHKKVVKNFKKATYFKKGYSGDKYCSICKTTIKGKATAKLTLKTPKFKVTKGNKQFKVKYTKVKDATGFQVRYKIKGKWKIKTFKATKNVTKLIKKLKKGTYKVQVRAMVQQGNLKAYSKWASVKKVKIK